MTSTSTITPIDISASSTATEQPEQSNTSSGQEEMVELEIDEENEPLWAMLKEIGINVDDAANYDEEDAEENREVEEGLDELMASSDTIVGHHRRSPGSIQRLFIVKKVPQ